MIFSLHLFSPKHHQELSRKSNYWNKIIWAWLLYQHFIFLQPFHFKYWLLNPQFFLPIPHSGPLSADPSPLITAKFINRDQQSLKGKADWTELSSLAVFSSSLVEIGSYLSPYSHWLAFQQKAAV